VGAVVVDFGTLEHEADGTVGQVQAHGHLGRILHWLDYPSRIKAAETLTSIVKVVVCAFVEIRLTSIGMHQVILFKQYHFTFGPLVKSPFFCE